MGKFGKRIMKPGDRVQTPDGAGTIKTLEHFSRVHLTRYCVELDYPKEWTGLKCFEAHEIERIKK
jgi:hypothetical protein